VNEAARPATSADLPRLVELAAAGVAEQVDARGGSVWSVREARALPAGPSLADDIADPERLVLVGTIDDAVVGYAAVRTEELRDGRRLGVVTDIHVEPGARAVGVGERLIEDVLAWCKERGCAGVDALALPGNRETKNFFETFGFTARALVVHRSL
jgi:ribosomal protein S18 acetylase RimI-like enzyme